MSGINTGGPAFPCPQDHINRNMPSLGMTLRDYFAAQVASGLAAHLIGAEKRGAETGAQANARLAYAYADAMLAAREVE